MGVAAALARPNIVRAADKQTLTVWWNQGFYPAEDQAFRTLVAGWEKKSGMAANVSMITGDALDEKVISALTDRRGARLSSIPTTARIVTLPQAAWNGKLVDVSDVVETQKSAYSHTALALGSVSTTTWRRNDRYYGVPIKAQALNIPVWRTLIEEAGYQMSDIPNTWDKFFEFFEPVQTKLRAKGMRHVYGVGYTLSTTGADPNNLFDQVSARVWRRRHRHARTVS